MVRKLFDFLYRETPSLNQAALLLGLFAFLSQVLAFLRDRLLAHIFGAGEALDLYYAAFKIPDFIFVTVASVVSLSVLIPFIVEEEARGTEELRKFIDSIFSFFSVLIISVSVGAFFLLPWVSQILFKGFSPEALTQVVALSRVLLLSPIILGFSNLFGSLTQAFSRFAIYALAPLLYNAGIIIGTISLGKSWGVVGVTTGVIIGALLHMFVQVPFVMKSGLFPRLTWNINFSKVRKVVALSLPRTFTLSMTHIATVFLVALASRMVSGSISILSFSLNLQAVPLSIIGVSYSLAAFPTLSRYFRENNVSEFTRQILNSARFIIFWSLPLSALFVVLRAQIVRVVLGSGLFDWNDTRLTAAALAILAISAVFQCLSILFIRGFYSAGSTRKPFYINLASTLLLVFGTWGLVRWFYVSPHLEDVIGALFRVGDIGDTVVLMLPIGFSIASIFNGLLYLAVFEMEFRGFARGLIKPFLECLVATVALGLASYGALQVLGRVVYTDSLVGIFLQGGLAGILGIIVAVVMLIVMGNQELVVVYKTLRQRFWKTEIIATDPEIV